MREIFVPSKLRITYTTGARDRSSMGKRGESERQIPGWSVKRIRARRPSQGANSQSRLQLSRLLEPEGSQQAQLATRGAILPGSAHGESTDGTELPSTSPVSRHFQELFVPDSPEQLCSEGKDSSRHRGACKLRRQQTVSTNFEELVVPDSPEETWKAKPCKLSRSPCTLTKFDELVVPESPDEAGASKHPSHRPSSHFSALVIGGAHTMADRVENQVNAALDSMGEHFAKLPASQTAPAGKHVPSAPRLFGRENSERNSLHLNGRQLSRTGKLRPLSEIQAGNPIIQSADKEFGPAIIGKLGGLSSSQCVQNERIPETSPSFRSRSSRKSKTISYEAIRAAKVRLARLSEEQVNVCSQAAELATVDPNENITFQTGSGRTVAISREAMEKARALLADGTKITTASLRESIDCHSGNLATPTKIPIPAPTFRTPSVRKFAISSEAISRARALLAPVEAVEDPRAYTSLVTGSGKPISISSHALDNVRAFSGEEAKEIPPVKELDDSVAVTSFVTGRGKSVSISSKALEQAREFLGDEFEETTPAKGLDDPVAITSFVTGSGKSVSISLRGLEKARAFLGEEFEEPAQVKGPDDPVAITSFVTGSGKSVSISSKALEKAREFLGDEFEETAPAKGLDDPVAITSFVTGSGKSVSISFRGLEKARAFLGEEFEEPAPVKGPDDPVAITSLVTGSRKTVSISSKALEKARAFLGEEFEETAPVKGLDDPVAITSFVTGSGKFVSISSKGLEKAGALLGEEFEEPAPVKGPDDPVAITSFVTGSGKSVSISSKALEKARAFLGEEFEEAASVEGPDNPVTITPFVTGSGKTVSISSKALEKARAVPGGECEETAVWISRDSELGLEGHISEAKFGQPSVIITNESSPELNQYKSDAGFFSAKLNSTSGEEYQWRNGRAFKPPRIRKRSDDTGASERNISMSIFGANFCGNSVTAANGHRQVQSLRPAYLKDGRNGWMSLREYIEGTPANEVLSLSPGVRSMTPDAADDYRIHHVTEDGRRESVGSTEIWKLLLDLGVDPLLSSKEWVANHYKWIIWKLASSERKHPRQAARRRLALDTVLDELKYRYDTELSGRRSAIRRITEGDSSASQGMVLLVSAIRHDGDDNEAFEDHTGKTTSSGDTAKIEVTDGWYRLNAVLDAPLTKYLRNGKLHVGQKLQVCGATLCCCPDSTSPLEAFPDSFLTLHVNGTYRASQNHRLGFYKGPIPSLAFRCIKPDGGLVPKAYVGVTRVYPFLFKETSADGFSIVRSVRAEDLALNQFERRRAKIAEEAILKLENSCDPSKCQDEKDEEGYELFDAVETAAEPDVLMAEMTPVQLKAFASYQAKRETSRQATIEDAVKEALQDAGLQSRSVTRVLKVRVTGLQRRGEENGQVGQEGMISIWEVSDEQEIVEGSVYCVSGLRPVTWSSSSNSNHLQLQSYRSTSWRNVPEPVYEKHFSFPYTCRAPTRLSDMDEKFVYREFDIAAKVLVVDKPFSNGSRRNQWVFMTDGSSTRNSPGDAWDEIQILAVKVSLPALAFAPVERSLVGSVVGFCNLVQQPKDHNCHWWVAEASDLSFFSSTLASHPVKHLQTAAHCVSEWDQGSPWAADSLRNLIQAMMSQGAQWYSF